MCVVRIENIQSILQFVGGNTTYNVINILIDEAHAKIYIVSHILQQVVHNNFSNNGEIDDPIGVPDFVSRC